MSPVVIIFDRRVANYAQQTHCHEYIDRWKARHALHSFQWDNYAASCSKRLSTYNPKSGFRWVPIHPVRNGYFRCNFGIPLFIVSSDIYWYLTFTFLKGSDARNHCSCSCSLPIRRNNCSCTIMYQQFAFLMNGLLSLFLKRNRFMEPTFSNSE